MDEYGKNKEVFTFENFIFLFCNTGTNDKIYWCCLPQVVR